MRSSKNVASLSFPAEAVVDFRRGFESLYVYSSIVEPRLVGDKIAPLLRIVPIIGLHGEMVTARSGHVPVNSRCESRIRQRRNRDKGRHGPTSAIRTREGDGDASLSTVQLGDIQMNFDDY